MGLYRTLKGCSCGSRGFLRGPNDGHADWSFALRCSVSRLDVAGLRRQGLLRIYWSCFSVFDKLVDMKLGSEPGASETSKRATKMATALKTMVGADRDGPVL